MEATRRAQSIAQRIDRALEIAAETGRTPVAIALGKEDYPAFQAWARGSLGQEVGGGDHYLGLRVRHLSEVFLSRLELKSQPGAPNALLL